MLTEPLRVVADVARVLDEMGVPYVVGGSLASSMYGIPRSTQDVDLLARLARIMQCAVERHATSVGESPTRQLVVPAGSNRGGGRGNEAVDALGVEGHRR